MEPIIAVVNGKRIEIPLGQDVPQMEDFQDFENWLNLERKYATGLKKRLESGEIMLQAMKGERFQWYIRTKNEFRRVKLLRIEEKLLYLNFQIRISLSCGKPNPKRCSELLQEFSELNFTALMITKNPDLVETIDFITKYEMKITQHKCNRSRKTELIKESEDIKNMASRVIRKFRVLFQVPDEKSFSEVYKEKRHIFEKQTAKMEQAEVLTLTDEINIQTI